ncbi:N-formylglutamate amidohydrolase [Nonlabens xiamenensis]|uniref:N-formylglutamate amidohydrolase n=1 Tax=Nonlabens xiamenensis TaxID=2341043 RepID=UPI000F60F390|nr:N-formylglutamate amidohydrolase [Nonlabens xiamenensis]
MLKLSIREIIERIEREEHFHAVVEDYSFSIKVEDYVPYVCAAVHDGHHFPKDLWDNCTHSEYERWYEEDPQTGNMISGLPITLIAHDSRFEYDLNRHPDTAVYEEAWGKELWKKPLPELLKNRALKKHDNFYKVVLTLIVKLEEIFGSTVFYDMHSYNYKRWDREVPVFNIGTANVDAQKYRTAIEQWQEILHNVELPIRQKVTCEVNDVFEGNGYFLKYVTANSLNTLVLATEISKVYCNEHTGQIYPEVVHTAKDLLTYYIKAHAHRFYDRHSNATI